MTRFWQHFASGGRGGVNCERLGIFGYPVPLFPSVMKSLGLPQKSGVEIWRLDRNSPAEQAGVLEDDIVIALARQPVRTMRGLDKILKSLSPRVEVEMAVLRGDALLARQLVLDEPCYPA
ncbi:MAG TPA: PDZ domain-containing protein [Gemmataceae bacterium]|nr:PDZ domain-containing protein [Gemmataceae bacterium]